MNERKFKILLLWLVPLGYLLALYMKYEELVEMGYLVPMLVSLPIGMFLSYLIFIKGIHDGKLFINKLLKQGI